MAKITLTPTLKTEYENLFNACIIASKRLPKVEELCGKLAANQDRYRAVGDKLGIPWFFIAVVHNMEASQSFKGHLHNGDPLKARTVQVPAGRPKSGEPPFTWEQSAEDALTMRGLGANVDWSLTGLLYQIEGYNGWGYRLHHQHVLTPYLWSFSNHYVSGKYVEDGTWSDTAVSAQCGAAVLLRRLAETHVIEFADQPRPTAGDAPLLVTYSPRKSEDAAVVKRVEDLQRWLNTFPGIFVKIDGVPGDKTALAYSQVTGSHLPGAPQA